MAEAMGSGAPAAGSIPRMAMVVSAAALCQAGKENERTAKQVRARDRVLRMVGPDVFAAIGQSQCEATITVSPSPIFHVVA
jgi:hypothetical protein